MVLNLRQGPCLRQSNAGMQGLNIMQFCKEYNAATQDKVGTVIPVEITCFEVSQATCTWLQARRALWNVSLCIQSLASMSPPAR